MPSRAGFPAQAALGLAGPVADRGEGALDGVRGPDVFPVFGREVIEGEKHVSVPNQLGDRLVVFDTIGLDEEIEGGIGFRPGLGLLDIVQMALGVALTLNPRCAALGVIFCR